VTGVTGLVEGGVCTFLVPTGTITDGFGLPRRAFLPFAMLVKEEREKDGAMKSDCPVIIYRWIGVTSHYVKEMAWENIVLIWKACCHIRKESLIQFSRHG